MKILLITPPYKKDKIFRKSMKHLGAILPPLGIIYLAATLEREGHDVKVIDATAESTVLDYNFDTLKKEIINFEPELVGVGANVPQIDQTNITLDMIKEIDQNIITIVGGPLVSSNPQFLSQLKNADYGILGEVDLAISAIVKKIENNEDLENSEGLIWRENGFIKSIKPKDVFDLDQIPIPARHLLKMEIYRPSPANYRRLPATTMMTCYDENTEVLTEKGWKLFNELSQNDKVATLDPRNDIIHYETPRHFTKSYFEGELLHFKSKHIDLLVTKNHNMYVDLAQHNSSVVQFNNGACVELEQSNKFMLVPAEQLKNHYQLKFKKNGIWQGKEQELFILPAIDNKDQKEIPMNLWLELFGYWIAEGSASKKSNNKYIIKIAQKDIVKRIKIITCLEKLGYNYYTHKEYFEISNKQLYYYLKQFGKHNEKYIPLEHLKLPREQLNILLDALVLGNGYKIKKTKQIRYITTSKKLADNVQEILFKLGISGTISIKKQNTPSYINGRLINSKKTCYVVSSNNKQNTPLFRKSLSGHIKELPYKGIVYCCEVRSHIIYVRRNGKSVWCGNSRGCPYKCIFCSRSVDGMAFRAHSAERVVEEIEQLVNKFGIKDIQMFDDTFTLNVKRVEDICNLLIEKKLDVGWNCMTRVDKVSVNLFKLMKKAGCYEVGFGIESGSERVLKFIKKSATKDQIRSAVKMAKEAGIDVRGFFMFGFPTETKNEIEETIKFAKELNVDVAQFMIATPYPGTEMWKIAEENGRINNEDWSSFTFYAPDKIPFSSELFTDQELLNFYKKAYRTYYLRPSFILRQVAKLRRLSDINRNWLAAKGVLGF